MDHKIRVTEIDLLRFLAAFSVMLFHYTKHFPAIKVFTCYGYLGVPLFFLISGFVIMMTALGRSPQDFIISRMVRLYPVFWVCCTITFLAALMLGTGDAKLSLGRYLANMTMLHAFFKVGHIDGVYWTLFIEMKFYFLILLLIMTRQLKRIDHFLGIWLAISIMGLSGLHPALKSFFITWFSAYFISGAVFYMIFRNGMTLYRAALLAGSYLLGVFNMALTCYFNNDLTWSMNVTVAVGLLTLFYAVFLLIALHKTQKIRSNAYMTLGALTYPLYLLHSHIWYVIYTNPIFTINKHLLALLTMVLMLALAYVVHRFFERPWAPVFKKFLEATFGELSKVKVQDLLGSWKKYPPPAPEGK